MQLNQFSAMRLKLWVSEYMFKLCSFGPVMYTGRNTVRKEKQASNRPQAYRSFVSVARKSATQNLHFMCGRTCVFQFQLLTSNFKEYSSNTLIQMTNNVFKGRTCSVISFLVCVLNTDKLFTQNKGLKHGSRVELYPLQIHMLGSKPQDFGM